MPEKPSPLHVGKSLSLVGGSLKFIGSMLASHPPTCRILLTVPLFNASLVRCINPSYWYPSFSQQQNIHLEKKNMKEARTAAAATSSKIVGPKRIKVIVVQQKSQQALNLNPFRKRLREHFLYATLKSLLPPQYCHSTSQVGSNFKETSIQEEATELELKPYDEVFNKDNSDGEHSDTGYL